MFKKLQSLIKRFPIISLLLGSWLLQSLYFIISESSGSFNPYYIGETILASWILTLFLTVPALLTVANLYSAVSPPKNQKSQRKFKRIEYATVVLGTIYSILFILLVHDLYTAADWQTVLINQQKHTPILRAAFPTIVAFALCAVAGYFILSLGKLSRMAPLVIVAAIAAMYIGVAECIVWIIQILYKDERLFLLCLMPANCIVITCKTIRYKMREWQAENEDRDFTGKSTVLSRINQKLCHAASWPLAAFLLMWPLLGIGIVILVLFGQQPDDIVRAWTETSDWRLSQQTSPPNLQVDDHYLCTVAAGGHRQVVKPVRMGERRGHRIVVNRQLCIANAFEQIIEEKTPIFHRHLRHFYDTCGFPIARKIRSKYTADLVYLLMKPLEWCFLAVIYLCDAKPENRIAIQYLPGASDRLRQTVSYPL